MAAKMKRDSLYYTMLHSRFTAFFSHWIVLYFLSCYVAVRLQTCFTCVVSLQGGIRTNTTVCLGKIACHLNPQVNCRIYLPYLSVSKVLNSVSQLSWLSQVHVRFCRNFCCTICAVSAESSLFRLYVLIMVILFNYGLTWIWSSKWHHSVICQ